MKKQQVRDLAYNTTLSNREIARQCGVSEKSVRIWTKDIVRSDTIGVIRGKQKYDMYKRSDKSTSGFENYGPEQELQELFCKYLDSKNIEYEEHVRCAGGEIDILTNSCMYELKSYLNQQTLKQAIGQLLLYKETIIFRGKLKIVCFGSEVEKLHSYINNLGIDVIIFNQ